jgi:hypothetical protein
MIKNYLIATIFIFLISLTNKAISCGYYPSLEDIRIQLFNPKLNGIVGFETFNYTKYQTEIDYSTEQKCTKIGIEQNLQLWKSYLKDVFSIKELNEILYKSDHFINFNRINLTQFEKKLKSTGNYEAAVYINFSKKCSNYNYFNEDPWKRKKYNLFQKQQKILREGYGLLNKETDSFLKKRYAFLLMRIAYYASLESKIPHLYLTYFNREKQENIVDNWALYFYAFSKDKYTKNVLLASVFDKTIDKRYISYFHFEKNIELLKAMKSTQNIDEKVNFLTLKCIKSYGPCFSEMKLLYSLDPKNKLLPFIITREINKLEDWISTPVYTNFNSKSFANYYENDTLLTNKQIDEDQKYASKLSAFVNTISKQSKINNNFYKISYAYLNLIAGNEKLAREGFSLINSQNLNREEKRFYNQIQLILKIKESDTLITFSKNEIQLLKDEFTKNNSNFIFIVSKELEFNNYKTEAALLFSKINPEGELYNDFEELSGTRCWKAKKFQQTINYDFYDNYLHYLDATYNFQDIEKIVNEIDSNKITKHFDPWLIKNIKKDRLELLDMLGRMYLRSNNWNQAFKVYSKIPKSYWIDKSNPYNEMLASNPFYTNTHIQHTPSKYDEVKYTKYTFLGKLIHYNNMISKGPENLRAYHALLVGNACFNMSSYGNAWIMKRIYWTRNYYKNTFVDDIDYNKCSLAKYYYLKAYKLSKNRKFKALCLRMAGRCEKFRLIFERYIYKNIEPNELQLKQLFYSNTFYKQLKKSHPEDYNELMSNCDAYDHFVNFGKN